MYFYFSRVYSSLYILNCTFHANVNMSSIVNVASVSPDCALKLLINNCKFNHNHMPSIITQSSKLGVNWKQLVRLSTKNVIISSNTHNEGNNMISMYNGEIQCSKTTITNNTYYENIIELNLSYMNIAVKGYLDISNIYARHVLTNWICENPT